MKTGQGRISIGRATSSVKQADGRMDFVSLEIYDANNHCALIEAKMSLAEFAAAVTGKSYAACDFRFFEDCPVGKAIETKVEAVSTPKGHGQSPALARAALSSFEVDGWIGRVEDIGNHHNRVARIDDKEFDVWNVHFYRYIDLPTKEEEQNADAD